MVFIFLKWVNTQRQTADEPLTNQGNSVSKMCKINRIQHEEQSNGDPAWSLWIQYEQGFFGAKSSQLVILVGESHNDSSSDVGTLFQVRSLDIIPQFNDFFSKILY